MVIRSPHYITLLVIVLQFALPFSGRTQESGSTSGKILYNKHCSRCHGVVGGGGEGPSLNRTYLPRASNDTLMADIIANGIPGTGMPGNWMVAPRDIRAIVAYVRGLATHNDVATRGDPKNGVRLFQDSGCLSCHMMGRLGSGVGPDLTAVGRRRGSAFIREMIAEPGKQKAKDQNGFVEYLVVDVTLPNGRTITGVRCNEDTFTIQLKDVENTFYTFRKDEVRSIRRRNEASIMPKLEFSDQEIDDLVAFFMQQN